MKWSSSIVLIRHGQSEYNVLRKRKENDPEYQSFKKSFDKGERQSIETVLLASKLRERYVPKVGDYKTPLTKEGKRQAFLTGKALSEAEIPFPRVIFYSPYLRTVQTLKGLRAGWEKLLRVEVIADDRIREQEHGLSSIYGDRRLFHFFNPEQEELRCLLGPYWYQYPQGESVSQVRDRIRLMTTMLIREWAEKNVWLVTHHLTILSIRANIEHLTDEEFIRIDEEEKPLNCGITIYGCNLNAGKDGKMELVCYNKRLFD